MRGWFPLRRGGKHEGVNRTKEDEMAATAPPVSGETACRRSRHRYSELSELALIAAAGTGATGRALDHVVSAGRKRIPLGAELEQTLASGLVGLRVQDVGVERMLVVGHLHPPVATPG